MALDGWAAPDEHTERATGCRGVGRDGRGGLHARPRAAARPERGDRRRQPRQRPRDVVVCAAGSMPGDLHKLWRTRDPKGYHVEYGYSCMGYEIAGGLGVRLADPGREVFVMVGDGSYLMMAPEIVTAVAEGLKLTSCSCRTTALRRSARSRSRSARSASAPPTATATRRPGARRRRAAGRPRRQRRESRCRRLASPRVAELEAALATRAAAERTTVVQVETDPLVGAPGSEAWWDVPVAEVSELDATGPPGRPTRQAKATAPATSEAGSSDNEESR